MSELSDLYAQKKLYESYIKIYESFKKLENSPEFILIISEMFLKEHPLNLLERAANVQEKEAKKYFISRAVAVKELSVFFKELKQNSETAERELPNLEKEIEDVGR